ncbi:winged helix-turn-helix domain-containing protein [Pedobacter sp. Hv1]|uniref:winged helix-turn-helix domain-containing protein n=1 Tax=Pedobacter sp. Hv1 TaxID=1740090 RepID=UPI0006D89160|nr:winged helix-turn-helix domain-containing protein [Pedobacter sp. Hv1]KQC02636.1 hypothetical protein AQF98_03410 [Pedobacter sp. Hv1]
MQKHQLFINERFILDEDLHTLKDTKTGTTTRLELRLLLLMSLLAKRKGEVVSREQLINDIWNNYGGAEEGLNQAISSLRKLLGDIDKKLIETVPKKGYRLNAEVSEGGKSGKPVLSYLMLVIALLLLVWIASMLFNKAENKSSFEPNGAEIDTTYQKKELDSIRKKDSIQNTKGL